MLKIKHKGYIISQASNNHVMICKGKEKRGKMKEYALYKGDDCLAIGTIKEIAKKMQVKYKTIYFYTMPAYKKRCKKSFNRLTMIKL